MKRMAAVMLLAHLVVVGCGPSAADKDGGAAVLADFLCTSDYLDRVNPLNPAGSMADTVPKFSAYLQKNSVPKRHVAAIRSLASASASRVDAFTSDVGGKMSETCPGKNANAFAIGFLIGMTDQVAVLRDAGV
jgi:hypothetical protein